MTNFRPYYGWWIVAGAIVCQSVFMSVGQVVVGVFMQPVTTELGWPVWQYTLGPSLAVGLGALAGIYAGPIVDRRGPRGLMWLGAVVSALCFYGLSQQGQLWIYLTLYIVAGLFGWNLFGPLVINATLVKWFVRKRGWALAIGSVGISLGGLIAPLTITAVVDTYGWRVGYDVLALFVLVTVIPIAFLMRRMPEDYGLAPDGDTAGRETTESSRSPLHALPSLTRGEALRTRSFWLLVVGFTFYQAALFSVLVHAIPFATDAAFTRQSAALALTVNGLGNLLSKAVWGYSLQRVEARRLLLVASTVAALGVGFMLAAVAAGSLTLLFVGFFCYGFGFGGTIPLGESLWAAYFGRAHIGAIRGVAQPLTIIGPVFGPILVGLWYDFAQTYQPAFAAIIGVYFVGGLLIWISREPKAIIGKELKT